MRFLIGFTLLATMTIVHADSCEPDDLKEPRALEAALVRCEETARVTTETAVRYAALCRGAGYCFKLAEPEGDRSSELAKRGYELAQRGRDLLPDRVEAHYLYALCLGVYLRENRLKGITRVSDLIAAAKRAVEVDERYDFGGPHRLLARLYSEAPRVIGPGDHEAAKKHLARLLLVAGDDEENKLTAVLVYHEIGDDNSARLYLRRLDPEKGRTEALRCELKSEKARLEQELK